MENRSRGAVTPTAQCWWCHVWNTGLPFGYVEKPEGVQQIATKIINVEAAGLVWSGEGVGKRQSNSNLQLMEE